MRNIHSALSIVPIIALMLLVQVISCSSSKKSRKQEQIIENHDELAQPILPDTFVLPHIPETITRSEDRAEYLVMHYWDRFDFSNRSLIERPDITEQAFVDYINILNYVSKGSVDNSLIYTLDKAEIDTAMYVHFITLFEKYLYDPNSPFRNEDFYIPVLKGITGSTILNNEKKSVYEFQLEMAMKNRVGEKANNFTYTLASGEPFTLYGLKSEYTLLMFSNPGCVTCETVMKQLDSSQSLENALALNSPNRTMLTILTVYPDDDLDEWLSHLNTMPPNWVHGYDKGMEITRKKLYDIRAIPTLYLLDKDKNVILKDTSLEAINSFF